MLVDVIIVVVVVASLLGAILLRRRSRDDVHSVEGYHRQIHTLEVINEHPAGSEVRRGSVEAPKHAYPGSTVRLTDSTTVRLTPPPPETVPGPAVPPVIPTPRGKRTAEGERAAEAVQTAEDMRAPEGQSDDTVVFDDGHPTTPEHVPAWTQDRAIGTMNRRPRQLAAPALALAAVTGLIVVLLVFGAHTTTPRHHHAAVVPPPRAVTTRPTVTTTVPPLPNVSAPQVTSASDATYEVGANSYTLVLAATSSACWIDVTGATGGSIFSGLMTPGQHQTIPATGLVSVEVGAPASFTATVNGTAVALPATYQTPLTLHFTPPASAAT